MEDTFFKVLAIALTDKQTPDHRLEYLLKKLHGKDSLNLDSENDALYERIKKISQEVKK